LKKILILSIILLSILFIFDCRNNSETIIPGTRIRITIPSGFYMPKYHNMYVNMFGSSISVAEMKSEKTVSINDFKEQLNNNELPPIIGETTFENIISIEEIGDSEIFYVVEGKQKNMSYISYNKFISINNYEVAIIIGTALGYNKGKEYTELKNAIRNAEFDENIKKDYSKILYFDIDFKKSFDIDFIGVDRFLIKYLGEKYNEEDFIQIDIGIKKHNYNITPDQYDAAASQFALRPPMSIDNVISGKYTPVEINKIPGILLIFEYREDDGSISNHINYILFRDKILHFLRSRIISENAKYYEDSMRTFFESFTLK